MKKVLLLALVFFIGFGMANAEDKKKTKLTPAQRAEKTVDKMDEKLDLTDEQEDKLTALYTEFNSKKYKGEERKVKTRELNQNIKKILTKEQNAKYVKMKQQAKKKQQAAANKKNDKKQK